MSSLCIWKRKGKSAMRCFRRHGSGEAISIALTRSGHQTHTVPFQGQRPKRGWWIKMAPLVDVQLGSQIGFITTKIGVMVTTMVLKKPRGITNVAGLWFYFNFFGFFLQSKSWVALDMATTAGHGNHQCG